MLASDIQEKINRKRLLVLAVLVVLTLITFFFIRSGERPLVDKNVFRGDLEQVDRIVIASLDDTVDLRFENSRWKVNAVHPADRSLVTLLFATLKQAEPKRELTVGKDSIEQQMTKDGRKVTLHSQGEKVLELIASGNASKTQSFFKDASTGKIYLVTIPGYRVYVSGIFELTEGGWRDKLVFGAFNWRNFERLDVKFRERPAESFTVQRINDGLFGIAGVKTDTARLNTFLDDVSLLTVVDYPESTRLRDSLLSEKSFLDLTVTDIAGKQLNLSVFKENKDGVLGIWMQQEPVVFDRQRVRNVIRPKSFFLQK